MIIDEDIKPSAEIEPWDTLTLEAFLSRIYREECPLQITMLGQRAGWFVSCGYATGRGHHVDLLSAILEAYTEWQGKRPKYEKQQSRRTAKHLARRLAKGEAT